MIPAAESVLLGDYLRSKGVDVHLLLSGLITHAEVDRAAALPKRGSSSPSGRMCCEQIDTCRSRIRRLRAIRSGIADP